MKNRPKRLLIPFNICFNNLFSFRKNAMPMKIIREFNEYIKIDNYILPKFKLPFQKESIEMLGIDFSKIKFIDEKSYFITEKLFATDSKTSLLYDTEEIMAYYNKFFKLKNPKNIDHVYISRSGATIRKVKEEEKFFKLIEKDGFVKVHLEEMLLQEQIDTVYNAKVLLVPHGAGCTNVIFTKNLRALFEIFPGKVTFKGYSDFCSRLSIPYFYAFANLGREFIEFDLDEMYKTIKQKIGHILK